MALWHRRVRHFGGQDFVHNLGVVDSQVGHDGVPLGKQGLQVPKSKHHHIFITEVKGFSAVVGVYIPKDSMHCDLEIWESRLSHARGYGIVSARTNEKARTQEEREIDSVHVHKTAHEFEQLAVIYGIGEDLDPGFSSRGSSWIVNSSQTIPKPQHKLLSRLIKHQHARILERDAGVQEHSCSLCDCNREMEQRFPFGLQHLCDLKGLWILSLLYCSEGCRPSPEKADCQEGDPHS